LAFAVLAVGLLWLLLLDPHDWNTIVPFYAIVFIAGPLGGIGLVAAVFGASPPHRRRALYLVLANLAIIAGPWVWLGIAT
jgi:hypothetical protein